MSVNALMDSQIKSISIKILVFGPQVEHLSENERTLNLQLKRKQIRETLEGLGHYVKYAEDIVDPDLPGDMSNAFFQELVIMPEYDLIVTLVDSPGSLIETGVIASKPAIAAKTSFFIDSMYSEGLAGHACQFAENLGADFKTYEYPQDLTDCHLLGFIKEKVQKVQIAKFLG